MADRQETRALFAGSFDPITLGHVDLIERASRLFNRLYVVVELMPSNSHSSA